MKRLIIVIFGIITSCSAYIPDASWQVSSPLRVGIMGTGYVGLVTGTCLASCGHHVICADTDHSKIERLQQGTITLYEPALEPLFHKACQRGTLQFTDNPAAAIQSSDIIIIAVGTPCGADGHADMSAVNAVVRTIKENANSFKLICMKSTVPIGTARTIIKTLNTDQLLYISNPEFLREGSAVYDFFHPDRIVIGGCSPISQHLMNQLYEPFITRKIPLLYTDYTSAETIKYASNSFLATKISFINEMANLCDAVGADIFAVAEGIGSDHRIGYSFLNPGPGFGGSCFPKDCLALIATADDHTQALRVIDAALKANEEQKKLPVMKLKALLGPSLAGKTITILGLSFKANTDDIRYSPAITTIELLLQEGALIRVYDPAGMPAMRTLFPGLQYCTDAYDALKNADGALILTEWDEFKKLNLAKVKQLMKTPLLVDARNILSCAELRAHGFVFDTIGRSTQK